MNLRVDQQESNEPGEELTEPSAQVQREAQHQRDTLLHLAVMSSHLGQPLKYNVYFNNKLLAEKGHVITERMVVHLRLLDPQHLFFKSD